jgi:hypothetical protein
MMLHDEDARLYLIVLTTLRLVPPGQVIDAIPQTTLAGLGHTRTSAFERLREPSFWQTAPAAAAAIVGDPLSHERYAVSPAAVDATRRYYAGAKREYYTGGDTTPARSAV